MHQVLWFLLIGALLHAPWPWGGEPKPAFCETAICTRGPRPLLIGLEDNAERDVYFTYNPAPDIGAYEYCPPYEMAECGDVTLDRLVDVDDVLWCLFCWEGPGQPHRTHLRKKATQELIPVACWMCDADDDGDVDLADLAWLLQERFRE
jgi:hypothetical protein